MRNAMPDGDSITVRAGFGLTASTHNPLSGLQPLVVQKRDGGYVYATTDLAALRQREGSACGWNAHWAPQACFCGGLAGLTLSLEFDHDGVAKSHPDPRVDRQRTHLFVASPHGAFPLAQIGLGLYRFRRAPELLDGFLIAGAPGLFWVPLLREFMLFGGVRSPAKADLLRFLRGGTSVGVNPGGNYEMTMSDHAQEQVFGQPARFGGCRHLDRARRTLKRFAIMASASAMSSLASALYFTSRIFSLAFCSTSWTWAAFCLR